MPTFTKACERLIADRAEKDYRPYHADEEELLRQRKHVFAHPCMFSILVPVYDTKPALFLKMLESVGEQTYGNWELILADASPDDSREDIVRRFTEEYERSYKDAFGPAEDKIRYVRVSENRGISANTNEALKFAKGDYTALLDHDDVLENTALFDIMSAIEAREKELSEKGLAIRVMAAYTDEDKVSEDGSRFFACHKKTGPDPVLLTTNNYVCHFFVADTDLVRSVGAFDSQYDGAQDHDLILRCFEGIRTQQIVHVPKVLYHWRSTGNSTAENPEAKLYAYEAGKRAVAAHFKRAGLDVTVTDSAHLGFFVPNYPKISGNVAEISPEELRVIADGDRSLPDADFIMILSADLVPLDKEYISDMMSCMSLPNIGAVTGKILTDRGRVESAGFEADDSGRLYPAFSGLSRHFSGYMHRANLDRLVEGFSSDCVLVRREAVKEITPELTLCDGMGIYYRPKDVFRRRSG